MADAVLTLNVGSSSVKFSAFRVDAGCLTLLASGLIDNVGENAHFSAQSVGRESVSRILPHGTIESGLQAAVAWLREEEQDLHIAAVGHRIVHGGSQFAAPVCIDEAVLSALRYFIPLAPLHQPHNLEGVEAAIATFPSAIQVACFDTAFHRTHPFIADTFALPRHFYDEGVRRYGFHGLSYEFVLRRLRDLAPDLAERKVIMAHLGNGASVCALEGGRSLASTMGFTALDGLPMGTRCGQLDPGVVLYMISQRGMSVSAVSDLLYTKSGLLGLSGLSHDMRTLEGAQDGAAREAVDYFVAHVQREIGGLAATLGGMDALVFCGGIGENASRVRGDILKNLAWMGIDYNPAANAENAECVSEPMSRVRVYVIKTNEERIIAEHTAECAGLHR